MGTFNINLGEDTQLNLILGQQLENEVTEVVFDFSAWQSAYGSGTVGLSVQRHGDDRPYAVVPTVSGTGATWNISDLDTARKGVGEVQVTYTVGTVIKKSVVYKFTVYRSLGENGEYPSPGQTWQEEIEAELNDVKAGLAEFKYGGGGLTDEARYALLQCFSKVAWIDIHGQDYYDALFNALFPAATLTRITAVYTQSESVYTHDPLDSLKKDLVVTAYYDDASEQIVSLYTLSGELTSGTSVITVSYGNKTTTINVPTITGVPSSYQIYDYIKKKGTTTNNLNYNQLIVLDIYDDLNALSCEFWYLAESPHSAGMAIWGGRDGSGYLKSYGFYAGDNTVSAHLHGNENGGMQSSINNVIHHVVYDNPNESPSSLKVDDGDPVSFAWQNNNTINVAPALLTNKFDTSSSHGSGYGIQCGRIRLFNHSNACVGDYFPCIRKNDSVIGMYDVIEQTFYTSALASACTIGNSQVKYEIGDWS